MLTLALIDDEEPILHSLKQILEPIGYRCRFFSEPEKALEDLERERADVVITDYKMPKLTGVDVLRAVREKNLADYVIMATGFADVENAIECVNHGAYAFFRKPVKIEELVSVLEKIEAELASERDDDYDPNNLFGELNKLVSSYNELADIVRERKKKSDEDK
jgi:DNA-binding NtrC family response regulator